MGRMNEPYSGNFTPPLLSLREGEGGERTPQRTSSPIFEKQRQSPLTGAYTVAACQPIPIPGARVVGTMPRNVWRPSPGSPGGLGLTPALECSGM